MDQNKELRRFADLMLESYDKIIKETLKTLENDMYIGEISCICSPNFLRTYVDTGSFSPLFEAKGFSELLDSEDRELVIKSYELFLNSLSDEELTRLLETLLWKTQTLKWDIKYAIQNRKEEIECFAKKHPEHSSNIVS